MLFTRTSLTEPSRPNGSINRTEPRKWLADSARLLNLLKTVKKLVVYLLKLDPARLDFFKFELDPNRVSIPAWLVKIRAQASPSAQLARINRLDSFIFKSSPAKTSARLVSPTTKKTQVLSPIHPKSWSTLIYFTYIHTCTSIKSSHLIISTSKNYTFSTSLAPINQFV